MNSDMLKKKVNPLLAVHKNEAAATAKQDELEVIQEQGAEAAEQPMDFKGRLEELDRLIQIDNAITAFTLDAVRGHVKQIMIDLKEQPELDSLLIDRDVHNILQFIRTVKDRAVVTVEKTKTRKATKKNKPHVIMDLTGFSLELGKTPASLDDLGKLDT